MKRYWPTSVDVAIQVGYEAGFKDAKEKYEFVCAECGRERETKCSHKKQ